MLPFYSTLVCTAGKTGRRKPPSPLLPGKDKDLAGGLSSHWTESGSSDAKVLAKSSAVQWKVWCRGNGLVLHVIKGEMGLASESQEEVKTCEKSWRGRDE